MARIKLQAKAEPPWKCIDCGSPGPRGRLSGGRWSPCCTGCTEKTLRAITSWNRKKFLEREGPPF